MVKIELNNNSTFELSGNIKVLTKLYKSFKLKHPGAFFLRKSGVMGKNWDGHIDYINEKGKFKPGLLADVYKKIKELSDDKIIIEDNRHDFNIKPKLIKQVGNNLLRGNQRKAVRSLLKNKVGNIPHYVGVFNTATNSGKTTMMAAIHLAFKSKIPTIILLNSALLFDQFKGEMPKLLPGEDIKFIRGKNIEFGNVTVAMAPTLSPKARDYQNKLAQFGICLVDEADLGTSKTYTNIIKYLFNCKIRVGLSGTIYMSKLKKDAMKNNNLKSFFGPEIFKITKKEMVEAGYSTDVKVTIIKGSVKPKVEGYPNEYYENITTNKDRAMKGIKRMRFLIHRGQLPALVVFQYIEHGDFLYKIYKKQFPKLNVALVSGKTPAKERKDIINKFFHGKIDILIGSYIIRRGMNLPLIRYIQNNAAGDSQETVSQIMGRGERKHESKNKYYLDDFWDEGKYLRRHSNHRRLFYQAEGFKVVVKK